MKPTTTQAQVTDTVAEKPQSLARRGFLASAAAGVAAATASVASAEDKFQQGRDWTGNHPVTDPEPAFEVLDSRFTGRQGNATLQRIWHGQAMTQRCGAKARFGWATGAACCGATFLTTASCAGTKKTVPSALSNLIQVIPTATAVTSTAV